MISVMMVTMMMMMMIVIMHSRHGSPNQQYNALLEMRALSVEISILGGSAKGCKQCSAHRPHRT